MSGETIGFVCPTYNAAELSEYTEIAIRSFLRTTPNGVVIVVDDASKSWSTAYAAKLQKLKLNNNQKIVTHHFDVWGGLTRSWNYGLNLAKDLGLSHAIAGNNDVVFTAGWEICLLKALAAGFAMAGPLSNAPGVTAKGHQEIGNYFDNYALTDEPEYLDRVAATVRLKYSSKLIASPVNGFFQFASVSNWIAGSFDPNNVYRPFNGKTSKGVKNPTPLMTLNEDELQHRWAKKGMRSAIACGSFIFHYRAVSRGDKYKRGRWFRKP